MYKYKKYTIYILTIIYIILSLIELIFYLNENMNIYGIYYLLINLVIIFLLVPVSYNYNRYYSLPRISKLIIVILIGIFNSFILNIIVMNNITYMDASKNYIDNIFVIKNILKPILYFILLAFTSLELKLDKVLVKYINKKRD